ncbi:hypothetical protein IS513_07260 [Proteus mirabilis]|uniref:hypothetical protein n=1 Tax=Proteus mirabilis TaxID=584 RepID=UPI001ADD3872|nr:hypothetical protein [Proteus mirabilis]MBO8261714.1 hypothetical protein [Proteus mirabilis]MBO8266970.1 hypothetical protein [Proteus mirabilis]MBO8268506.1 hypothetical protein [Proteus mirabilis]MBO8271500.1 hypothetical protein [Proteus mirabilis]MBO8275141.1 hypothetical protein [Proteus mirabilis]
MSFHAVDWFTVGGSLSSACAVFVAVGIYLFQRHSDKKEKKDIKKLKIDAINRLLAHRSTPLCQRANFLAECCVLVLTTKLDWVNFDNRRNTISFGINARNISNDDGTIARFNVPEGYYYLNESTLLTCAELSDRKNELLQTSIRINIGGQSFKELIDIIIRHAENNSVNNIKAIFSKNEQSKYKLIDHLYEVFLSLEKLEPEIECYKIYVETKNKINTLKKQF